MSREHQQRVGDHLGPRVARRFRRRVEPVRGLPTDRVGEYVPPDLLGDRGRPRRAGPGRDADREQVPPPEQEAELTAPAEQGNHGKVEERGGGPLGEGAGRDTQKGAAPQAHPSRRVGLTRFRFQSPVE